MTVAWSKRQFSLPNSQVLFRDLDGSLTGLPGGGWVVPDSPLVPDLHCNLSVPEFSGNSSSFNGTVCSSEVHFVRMAWNRAEPMVSPSADTDFAGL